MPAFGTVPMVSNVKFSLKLAWDPPFNTGASPPFKSPHTWMSHPNFFVRKSRYTFILFVGRQGVHHVNVTKVPHLSNVQEAQEDLLTCFTQVPLVVQGPRVDNLTCLTRVGQAPLDLFHLYQRLIAHPLEGQSHVRFNLERFPGLFLHFKDPKATVLWFSSGKAVIVGCRQLSQVQQVIPRLSNGTCLSPSLPGGRHA